MTKKIDELEKFADLICEENNAQFKLKQENKELGFAINHMLLTKCNTLQKEYVHYKHNVTNLLDSLFEALEDDLTEAYDKADSLEISICEARLKLINQIYEEIVKLNKDDSKKKRKVTPDFLAEAVMKSVNKE